MEGSEGRTMKRRDFVKGAAAAAGAAASVPASLLGAERDGPPGRRGEAAGAPAVHGSERVEPVVISDRTGFTSRDAGGRNAVERAFEGIAAGEDVLDALVAGVEIPELDPEETGVGYGGVPNAEGVVQLDASCSHGPTNRSGAVAALEGVKTPAKVARAVMEETDHRLLAGRGAQEFARVMGFEIHDSLNTDNSLRIWREWKRRIDPEHWLDPDRGEEAGRRAAMEMIREGLIPASTYYGTINCDAVSPGGDLAGVTTTSGLWFKIPGRVGDSPILGAGLYVDNEAGAAGSTGRGEANLANLSAFLAVENMRRGMHPKDAGMTALQRIRERTAQPRLLNERGEPAFNVRFFAVSKEGEYAGTAMYASETVEHEYAVCTEGGSRLEPLEPLLEGSP